MPYKVVKSFMILLVLFHLQDRVPFAHLSIIKKGDTLKSIDFDHKNPPKELKELVDLILSTKEH